MECIIILSISIENRKLSLLCLYGPNEDTLEFYQNLSNINIDKKFQNDEMIIVGDLNLVQVKIILIIYMLIIQK